MIETSDAIKLACAWSVIAALSGFVVGFAAGWNDRKFRIESRLPERYRNL